MSNSFPPVMSNSTTNETSKGIRYTPEQKKEVIDFAVDYNAANGRGGQSKAAEKFNISQITIASWLKAAGAAPKASKKVKAAKAPRAPKAPKAAKEPKAAKAPKAPKAGKTKQGTRYTDEQKKEVTDFVVAYNAANGGRGGPSQASKKFNISPLTVGAWLAGAGLKSSKKGAKATKAAPSAKKAGKAAVSSVSGSFDAKLSALLALSKQIASAESELVALNAKFTALKASL